MTRISPLVLFVGVHFLAVTTLSSTTWSFNRCPPECHCSVDYTPTLDAALRTVDCSHRHLAEFPRAERIPADAQVLRVDGNAISDIGADLRMYLPDLLLLNMSSNRLSHLPAMFDGVYNCHHLDLSVNRLTQIEGATFEGLFNLRTLNLSANRIYALLPDALLGLTMLESVDLSGNLLSVVRRESWTHTKNVRFVDLSMNRVELVQYNALQPLHKLERLDLSHNQLRDIDDHALGGLDALRSLNLGFNSFDSPPTTPLKRVSSSLRKLVLDGNPMATIGSDAIADLDRLEHLHLAGMPNLHFVQSRALVNLPRLTSLHLNDNPRLAYVDVDAMVGTPAVRHLYAHNNRLAVVDESLVARLSELARLAVYGNPLRCDASMAWLRSMMDVHETSTTTKVTVVESERIICASPVELAFQRLEHVREIKEDAVAPIIVDDLLPERVQVMPGASVTLYCRAVGNPRAHILWMSPQGYIHHREGRRRLLDGGRTLHIASVSGEDNGAFTCLAESPMGQATHTTSITVHRSPIDLVVVETSSDSVTVAWSINQNHNVNGGQLMQLVYRNVQNGSVPSYARTLMANERGEHRVDGLQSGDEYELCLAMQNEARVLSTVRCVCARTTDSSTSMLARVRSRWGVWTIIALIVVAIFALVVVALVMSRSTHYSCRGIQRYAPVPNLSSPFRRPLRKTNSQTPIVAV